MTLADSSVWIDMLRQADSPQVRLLRDGLESASIAVADLVVLEVLQGLRDDPQGRVRQRLLDLEVHTVGGLALCLRAAENYRILRSRGFTIRSTIDCLIATFCIEGGHTLLHSDRDFDPFETHLGLRVLHP